MQDLIERLQALPSRDGLMNPYASARGSCAADSVDEIGEEADALRLANLLASLDRLKSEGRPALLVGEAPGYQGARWTGMAFTSEVQVAKGEFPLEECRLLEAAASGERKLNNEPSAKAIWEAFERRTRPFALWNSVPLHPHEPGQSRTNRKPTPEEVALGKESLEAMIAHLDCNLVVAIGRVAEEALQRLGFDAPYVRHPSYGGKPDFMRGLEELGVIGPPAPNEQRSLF